MLTTFFLSGTSVLIKDNLKMKKTFYLLYVLLLIIACATQRPEKPENVFMNNAIREAKAANKLLILDFWSPSSAPSVALKKDIFENENNAGFLDKNFIINRLSPSDSVYHPLMKRFRVEFQCTVIVMDKNGNEIDRSVGYNGSKDSYIDYLKDISEGKNLYSVVFQTYKKDTMNVMNNYVLAQKYMFRYQIKDAVGLFSRVLVLDPDNKQGLNPECRFRIAESELFLTGKVSRMEVYVKRNINKQWVPKAYGYLIDNLISNNDTTNCISLCEEASYKFPDNSEILNKYARAIISFKMKNDYGKALVMVRKSISLNPGIAGFYFTEAWIYSEMGDKSKAAQLQNKAIELFPNTSSIQDHEKFGAE